MEKLLSPRRICVLFVAHVKTSADRSVDQELTIFSHVLWKLAVKQVSKYFTTRKAVIF